MAGVGVFFVRLVRNLLRGIAVTDHDADGILYVLLLSYPFEVDQIQSRCQCHRKQTQCCPRSAALPSVIDYRHNKWQTFAQWECSEAFNVNIITVIYICPV